MITFGNLCKYFSTFCFFYRIVVLFENLYNKVKQFIYLFLKVLVLVLPNADNQFEIESVGV